MNVTKFPKVRDLTGGGGNLPIETDGSAVYDLLLTVWAIVDDREDHGGFEIGPEWFQGIVDATDESLRLELEELGGVHGSNWLALIGMIVTAPHPHDVDRMLGWLKSIEGNEFRLGLLSYQCNLNGPDVAELAGRAVRGDESSLDEVLADSGATTETVDHFRAVFSLPVGELRDRMLAALRRFRSEVFAQYEEEFGQTVSRAAAASRAFIRGADPERVIEEVTNGAEYRIQPGVARLVLVPSVVLRPWAIIDQYRHTLFVAYGVADEFIDADPDAPPSWLVKMHKALGDDRRLRILRRLSEGGASLDDLTEMLGLTKSTVHHHLGLLRSAGLVRVKLDPMAGTKHYAFRPSVLPEAQRSLESYLRVADATDESTAHRAARSEA
jgi:DNA-binding transcriptional ArsR family regulator